MSLKLKLKLARIEKGQVQSDIAKVLNVTEQTYNRKELGIRDFTLKECIKLSRYFGKSMDELFMDSSDIRQ